jgi:hypothetical protein
VARLYLATVSVSGSQVELLSCAPVISYGHPERPPLWTEPTSWSDEHAIVEGIKNGTVIGVSDGSFKASIGTFSWILTTLDKKFRLEGVGVTPGEAEYQSAYRSELCGMLAIVTIIECLANRHKIQITGTPILTIGCDGEAAVKQVSKQRQDLRLDEKQADILGAVRSTSQRLGFPVNFCHVDGHQDDHVDESELDIWGRLNVLMDRRAKAHWRTVAAQGHVHPRLPNEPWCLKIGERKVSCNIKEEITNHIHGPSCRDYWLQRQRIGTLDGIAWECMERALGRQPLSRQREITKHASGHFSIGKKMKQWGLRSNSSCPLCGREGETLEHMYRCQDKRATDIWDKSVTIFRKFLQKRNTCPDITDALIDGLSAWRREQIYELPASNMWFGLRAAVESQSAIGWGALLNGFLSTDWLASQDAYFKWRKKRNTGAVWASSVISELWAFAWRIWEHRNDIVHDPGDGLARRTLLREVEEEKALGGRYLPQTARALFRKSMDYLKKAQSDYLENWLRRIRAARALAEAGVEEIRPRRRRKRALATDQQLLTRFIRRRVDVSHPQAMEIRQQQSAQSAQQPQRIRKRRRHEDTEDKTFAQERALMARFFCPRNNNPTTI